MIAVVLRKDQTNEEVRVETAETQNILGWLADKDMSWGSYDMIIRAILRMDDKVRAMKEILEYEAMSHRSRGRSNSALYIEDQLKRLGLA